MRINVKGGTNAGWDTKHPPTEWECPNCKQIVNPTNIVNKCPLCGEYKFKKG